MNVAIKQTADLGDVRTLFLEYEKELGVPICFENFDKELASLPGEYGPPDGSLYVAYCGDEPAGCAALRRFEGPRCEMRRLYVRPKYRGLKIGEALARKIIGDGIAFGYQTMLLDTFLFLESAVAMYRKLGFTETGPYYDDELMENEVCFRLDLQSEKTRASFDGK
ncbi:MAG: GNAT family N-acetyltransferase [Christensenellales bacterium]